MDSFFVTKEEILFHRRRISNTNKEDMQNYTAAFYKHLIIGVTHNDKDKDWNKPLIALLVS